MRTKLLLGRPGIAGQGITARGCAVRLLLACVLAASFMPVSSAYAVGDADLSDVAATLELTEADSPTQAVPSSWDVSAAGDGSLMASVASSDNPDTYTLTISGEGAMKDFGAQGLDQQVMLVDQSRLPRTVMKCPGISFYGENETSFDYALSYENNVDPGQASIVTSGMGLFTGTLEIPFSIQAGQGSWEQDENGAWLYRLEGGLDTGGDSAALSNGTANTPNDSLGSAPAASSLADSAQSLAAASSEGLNGDAGQDASAQSRAAGAGGGTVYAVGNGGGSSFSSAQVVQQVFEQRNVPIYLLLLATFVVLGVVRRWAFWKKHGPQDA